MTASRAAAVLLPILAEDVDHDWIRWLSCRLRTRPSAAGIWRRRWDWQEFTLVPGRLLRRRRDGDRPGHGAGSREGGRQADGWLWRLGLCTCSWSRMDGSSGRPIITTPHCGCRRPALDSCASTVGGQSPARRDDAAGSQRGGRQGGVRGVGHARVARCLSSCALPPGQQTLSPICAACYPRNSATSVAPARTTTT